MGGGKGLGPSVQALQSLTQVGLFSCTACFSGLAGLGLHLPQRVERGAAGQCACHGLVGVAAIDGAVRVDVVDAGQFGVRVIPGGGVRVVGFDAAYAAQQSVVFGREQGALDLEGGVERQGRQQAQVCAAARAALGNDLGDGGVQAFKALVLHFQVHVLEFVGAWAWAVFVDAGATKGSCGAHDDHIAQGGDAQGKFGVAAQCGGTRLIGVERIRFG